MLWFILCVAVLNMAAGFGLGVYLARFHVAGAPLPSDDPAEFTQANPLLDQFERELAEDIASDRETEVAAEDPTAGSGDVPDGAGGIADTAEQEDVSESAEDSVMADLDAAVSLALGDIALPESKEVPSDSEQGSADSPDEEVPPEDNGLSKFHSQLESFCADLIELDDRLRAKRPETGAELKSHVDSVTESSKKQDEACREAEESVRSMITSESIEEERGEAVIAAIQQNRQGAAETAETLSKLDFEGDVAGPHETVLECTAGLLEANHGLRDRVSDAIATTPDAEESEVPEDEIDLLTKLPTRAALDTKLANHWAKDPHHARVLSFTLIDLDQFAKFNRNHGPAVGDRALRALARVFTDETPEGTYVARFSGQRFALLAIDRDLKQAVSDTERVRQTVESLRLEHGGDDLEITLSCGVVAASPEDTHNKLYGRAIASVQEAKRYGRNRSFVHEGEYPTPVVPPNFAPNEKHVTL